MYTVNSEYSSEGYLLITLYSNTHWTLDTGCYTQEIAQITYCKYLYIITMLYYRDVLYKLEDRSAGLWPTSGIYKVMCSCSW